MGLLLMYSMKDSVTSTEICSSEQWRKKGVLPKLINMKLLKYSLCVCASVSMCTHVLDVVKAQRSSFASVLQRLCGKSLVMAMQKTKERKTNEYQGVTIIRKQEECVQNLHLLLWYKR